MEGKDEAEKKQWYAAAAALAAAPRAPPAPRGFRPAPSPVAALRDSNAAGAARGGGAAGSGDGVAEQKPWPGIREACGRADVATAPSRAQARLLGRVRVLHDHHGPDELPLLVHPVLLLCVARARPPPFSPRASPPEWFLMSSRRPWRRMCTLADIKIAFLVWCMLPGTKVRPHQTLVRLVMRYRKHLTPSPPPSPPRAGRDQGVRHGEAEARRHPRGRQVRLDAHRRHQHQKEADTGKTGQRWRSGTGLGGITISPGLVLRLTTSPRMLVLASRGALCSGARARAV